MRDSKKLIKKLNKPTPNLILKPYKTRYSYSISTKVQT